MSEVCRPIQNRLAEEGRGILDSDATARAHVDTCEACQSFAARLARLELALEALPVHDAPDALVEKLLARKELEEPIEAPPKRRLSASLWRLSAGAAAAGILLAVMLSQMTLYEPAARRPEMADMQMSSREAYERDDVVDELRFHDGDVGPEGTGGGGGGFGEAPPTAESNSQGRVGPGVGGGFGGGVASTPPPAPPAEPGAARSERAFRGRGSELLAPRAKAELEEQETDTPARLAELRKDDAGTFALERRVEDKRQNEGFELPTDAIDNAYAYSYDNAVVGGRDHKLGLSSLVFQDASGYWSNTYVPGDPTLRFLDARLRELARAGAAAQVQAPHDSVRRVNQPFDAPERNALAVFLAADRRAVTEPTRLTLQVGLKAMARQASRRPAMNVAVVLDRTGGTGSDHPLVAFARAMQDASELGDTIRYVVAGSELEELDVEAVTFATLPEALEGGIAMVASSEDPNTVLGANLVILVTGRTLGSEMERLETLAHRSAVGGIPVSAVALGAGTNAAEIQRLALAGQGSRRLLAQPSDAASLVDAELTAASRVVARAVRLRIRLMPGVELVDILGSRRLDTIEADRVREAEQSIDQRLARNLGIAADRGEDEEGIQIVIPGFYASDSHVILLDVVANGPGPLADVTARYKDVGSLSNAVARASLTLERGELEPTAPTAIEANVTKNVLAFRLSEGLEAAGESLARGDAEGAVTMLTAARQSLAQAIAERPLLDAPDVRADVDLLDAYLTLLGTGVTSNPALSEYVSASLRFASRLKLTSRVALD